MFYDGKILKQKKSFSFEGFWVELPIMNCPGSGFISAETD